MSSSGMAKRTARAVGAALMGAVIAGALVVAAGTYILHDRNQEPTAQTEEPTSPSALPQRELSWSEWDEAEAPEYWTVLGPAVVDIDIPAGTICYSPLDELGRAGRAAGRIDYAMMAAGIARERGDISSLRPSGWGRNAQAEIELPGGRIYRGYFWNRSHLIAKSLGGQDRIENLVCGTRTQNVGANDGRGGMAWCEGLVRSWLEDHPTGTVFYSTQPVYEGDEPVCRSVIVDIRSSDGDLDLEVEVHNAAKGHGIDYGVGGFSMLEDAQVAA